jgi:hypothetical protein
MAWEAQYEGGNARPVFWLNTETGEQRYPADPPAGASAMRLCAAERVVAGMACPGACLDEVEGRPACLPISIPKSLDTDDVETWLAAP